MNVAKLTNRMTDFADYFIPDDLKVDRNQHNQARVFLISHLFGPFIGSAVPLAFFLLDPTPGPELAVLAGSILAFWVFPPLLKLVGHYRTLAIASVQNLIFCILWSCYFYGGITSPTLSWVLIIPLLAFFYIGESMLMRLAVVALFAVNISIFLYLYAYYPPSPHDIAIGQVENLGIVSMVGTSLYVAMMALYFAKVYESQGEMEAMMRKHLAASVELREATALAERAGAAKAEFLAKMSHELRTPLNAIIGYSQILREDAEDEGDDTMTHDLVRIHDAGTHLLKLINEILDLAKMDAGRMEVFKEPIAIAMLARQVVDEFRAAAEQQGNTVTLSVAPDVGVMLVDSQKLHQVLSQIVDNAIKFTSNGHVVVEVKAAHANEADTLALTVRDTGCGISAEDLPRLFELFTVLGAESSSKYGGTGLGLALSRRLCRLLGGDIVAESQAGAGTTFTITMPARRPGASGDTNKASPDPGAVDSQAA